MVSIQWGMRHLEPWFLIPTIDWSSCRHCNRVIIGFSFLKLHINFVF